VFEFLELLGKMMFDEG
jgi:hypothetical protein